MRVNLHDDEPVDRDRCERLASEWLAHVRDDPDLGVDTRVSVPIYVDAKGGVTRLWATLGVRLTRLTADFGPRAADQAKECSRVRRLAGRRVPPGVLSLSTASRRSRARQLRCLRRAEDRKASDGDLHGGLRTVGRRALADRHSRITAWLVGGHRRGWRRGPSAAAFTPERGRQAVEQGLSSSWRISVPTAPGP